MYAIADTNQLIEDGIISQKQAMTIEARGRESMVFLGINSLLCFGIFAATGGLIFWLSEAIAVAICGAALLATGLIILVRGGPLFRMFGNASALIGGGMLVGGAVIELISKYETIAGWTMILGGAAIVMLTGWALHRGQITARFVIGAILLMGGAAHIGGIGILLDQHNMSGLPISIFYLYVTTVLICTGFFTNVRLVTALAIAPFAQALDTGTFYFDAAYVFYSPESTLSILQMTVLIGLCVWIAAHNDERIARHARVLAVMAFVVANLCALVGSIWGDVVGFTLWGPGHYRYSSGTTYESYRIAMEAFRQETLVISENFYAVLWAIAIAAMVLWAAHRNQRGLFNTSLTFGAIHAYTQMFESFGDEPLAYVIGGLAAILLAWGMWQLNHWIVAREKQAASVDKVP